jgi:hypothetical protein
MADSPDLLLAIADKSAPSANNKTGNTLLKHLFSLCLSGSLPASCWRILRDNYLMALHNDYINRPPKLRPLGIGTALHCLLDRHITHKYLLDASPNIFSPFNMPLESKEASIFSYKLTLQHFLQSTTTTPNTGQL